VEPRFGEGWRGSKKTDYRPDKSGSSLRWDRKRKGKKEETQRTAKGGKKSDGRLDKKGEFDV
jgi:hypothetical protein